MSTDKEQLKYYKDKLFIGGLSFKTTDQSLEKYFSKYGAIKQANVMKYTDKQVSRGFGFCIFENPQSAELAMQTKFHIIDGRRASIFIVDVRWALPKEMAPPPQSSYQQSKPAIRKIFVGGISVDTKDEDLRQYFSKFGEIESATVMYQHDKRHSRGFGFVLFKNSSSVNEVISKAPHVISGKTVDVKKAYPKDESASQPDAGETVSEFDSTSYHAPRPELNHLTRSKVNSYTESPQSPLLDDYRQSLNSERNKPLPLEFFDEQDNNPLPATYNQGGFMGVSSPNGYSNYMRPYSGFDSMSSNPYFMNDAVHPSPQFYTQTAADSYNHMDNDWNMSPLRDSYKTGSFFDNRNNRLSPSRFGSLSGDGDLLPTPSVHSLSHRNSLSSPPYNRNSYFVSSIDPISNHEMPLFDSVTSHGSQSGFQNRGLFNSDLRRSSSNYCGILATDPGVDDQLGDFGFLSNNGRFSVGELQDGDEGSLFNSGRGFDSDVLGDNGMSLSGTTMNTMNNANTANNNFTWSNFNDKNGEDIDSLLSDSLKDRSFSKNRRSKNHLIFNSGSANPSKNDQLSPDEQAD